MEGIKEFYRNHIRRRLTSGAALLVVVVLCLTSLTLRYFSRDDAISPLLLAGAVVVPLQEGINEIGSFLFRSEQERLDLRAAREQIEELEKENIALRMRIDGLDDLESENRELRTLLNAAERLTEYSFVEATVIGNDGVNIFRRFLINRGTRDGIAVDMNVVSEDGLVGLVTEVGLNYAVVTTIIEDGINVSAMTKNGHENCIVTGDASVSGPSVLKLGNVLLSVDIENDFTLVTSDISDKYLPGLLIGYADQLTPNADGLTRSGTVSTAADFTKLKEVIVITDLKEKTKEAEE